MEKTQAGAGNAAPNPHRDDRGRFKRDQAGLDRKLFVAVRPEIDERLREFAGAHGLTLSAALDSILARFFATARVEPIGGDGTADARDLPAHQAQGSQPDTGICANPEADDPRASWLVALPVGLSPANVTALAESVAGNHQGRKISFRY